MNGFIVIDKPKGVTSFAAARSVGRALGQRHVGHGGTLDPMATGVLPICVGEATKLSGFLLGGDKEYEAEITFGTTTDTLDAEGKVLSTRDAFRLRESELCAVLDRFRGPISQVPPMYSALRKEGRRLYDLAREGVEVERPAREVEIRSLELLSFRAAVVAPPCCEEMESEAPAIEPPSARVRVACSKGTYIRVLAADLGEALGVGAHLSALRRLRSGPFSIDRACALDEVLPSHLLPLVAGLPELPKVVLPGALAGKVATGTRMAGQDINITRENGVVALLSEAGALLALAQVDETGRLRFLRVFNYGLTVAGSSAILRNHSKKRKKEGLHS